MAARVMGVLGGAFLVPVLLPGGVLVLGDRCCSGTGTGLSRLFDDCHSFFPAEKRRRRVRITLIKTFVVSMACIARRAQVPIVL